MPPRPRFALLACALAALALPAGAHARASAGKAPTHLDLPSEIHVNLAAQVRAARLSGVRAVSPTTTQEYLPTTWCGDERTTDDSADSTLAAGEHYYKLVYAYASDQPDRFALWKDVLQADVSLIGQFMAQQDGATKSPRFDMGTNCGPGYADIQVVHLPGTRATYADDFYAITAAVSSALGASAAPRNVVILADGLTGISSGLYGLGEHYVDFGDVPGSENPHNGGDLYAALFAPLNYDPTAPSQFAPGFWPEGMLHEITHTLGAVNDSAPHRTGNGHCTDGSDVMCYADGGPYAGSYSSSVCPALTGSQAGMTQTYDCNRDDYFNPDPAAGSYLDTHWNVFNSDFEAPCPTIGNACGSGGSSVPVEVAAPTVAGTAQQGSVLTASAGAWTGSPGTFAYQWQRTPVGGGAPAGVTGQTGTTYVLGSSDVGRRLRVMVVASNVQGDSVPASSALTGYVTAPAPPPAPVTTTTTTTTVTAPPPPPPVVTTPVAPVDSFAIAPVTLRRRGRGIVKVTVTRRISSAGVVATVVPKRVKVTRRGTYRLSLCVGTVCTTKPFRARHGRASIPAIVAASRTAGAVTLRLIGPGGRAAGAMS